MADDEKATRPGPLADHKPSSVSDPDRSGVGSEWTVSDTRGPLEKAGSTESSEEERQSRLEAAPQSETSEAHTPLTSESSRLESPGEKRFGPSPETVEPDTSAAGSPPTGLFDPEPAVTDDTRKRSVWPIAAGVIIGAIIGAGSAAIIDGLYSASPPQDPRVASLAARVDALEKRSDAGALKASVADLDRKVAALQASTGPNHPAAASTSSGQTSNGADTANAAAPGDLGPMRKQVAALQSQVETLKSQGSETQGLDTKIAALATTIAGMKKDTATARANMADVESQQKTIATQQKLLADKVMVPALAVVADSLVQQIDAGEPYATQVAALETLGADPAKIAVLKENADRGVLSAKTLAAKFAPLAEPISATAHKAPVNAGFVDRLKSGMLSMVSVRSVDDTGGTDLPSRVARIKADLAHDDVAGALSTWNALPADAKIKGQDWSLLAKAHAEAMAAARALQHDAIVSLGAKKS